MNAIDLAATTGDAQLLRRLSVLANDPAALPDMGIREPNTVAAVRERAAAAVAGRMSR